MAVQISLSVSPGNYWQTTAGEIEIFNVTGSAQGLYAAGSSTIKATYKITASAAGVWGNSSAVVAKTHWNVFDSFTDTNGTALTSHTPDFGATPAGSSNIHIESNTAQSPSNIAYATVYYAAGISDFYLKVLATGTWDADGSAHQALPDVMFRRTDDSNYCMFELANDSCTLYKRVSGSFTNIASAAITLTSATAHTIEIWASGNHKTCAVDGVILVSDYSDSTYNSNTHHGFTGVTTATPPAQLATWDNLGIAPITPWRWIMFGDSRTEGYGLASPSTMNPGYVAGNLLQTANFSVSLGNPGDTIVDLQGLVSSQLAPEFDNTVTQGILVFAGFNDFAKLNSSPATAHTQMTTLISDIRTALSSGSVTNYKLIVSLEDTGITYGNASATPSTFGGAGNWADQFNALVRADLCGADGYFDITAVTLTYQTDTGGTITPTHVHPDQSGASTLARAIAVYFNALSL